MKGLHFMSIKKIYKLQRNDIKGFIPFLFMNLVPLITLAIVSYSLSSYIYIQNEYVNETGRAFTVSRFTDIFNDIKTSYNNLTKAADEYSIYSAKTRTDYFKNDNFMDFKSELLNTQHNFKYIDNVFVYIKDDDIILSTKGIQDSFMFHQSLFIDSDLSYNTFKEHTASSRDSDFLEYIKDGNVYYIYSMSYNKNISQKDIRFYYIIPKKHFYNEIIANNEKYKANTYIFNIKNRLVLSNILHPTHTAVKEKADLYQLPKSNIFEYRIIVSEEKGYTLCLAEKKNTHLTLPLFLIFGTLFMLLLNTVFSILTLQKVATRNYIPILNISKLLNVGFAKNDYTSIEKSVRILSEKNQTLENQLISQKHDLFTFILKQSLNNEPFEQLNAILEKYNIRFSYSNFLVIVFFLHETPNPMTAEKITKRLTEYLNNAFNTEMALYTIYDNDKTLFVINTDYNDQISIRKIAQIVAYASNFLKDEFHFDANIGISNIHDSFSKISHAYIEALNAMYCGDLNADNTTIHIYSESSMPDKESLFIDVNTETDFYASIQSYDMDKALEIVDSIITKSAYLPKENAHNLMYGLAHMILKIPYLINIPTADSEINNMLNLEILTENISTPEKYKNTIHQLIKKLLSSNCEKADNITPSKIINIAISYTNKHFSNPNLSLNSISEYLGYSPNYFSKIFKKQYGKGWVDYLHEYRINEAKKLIIEGVPINKIYSSIGYTNIRSFNRVFKKLIGMTPSEFYVFDKETNS